MLSEDYRLHLPGFPELVDREGHNALVMLFRSGFPDWVETVEDVLAEDDRVVARIDGQGIHVGEFQGVEATGRHVSVTGIGIARTSDGRIVEAWAAYDGQDCSTSCERLTDRRPSRHEGRFSVQGRPPG